MKIIENGREFKAAPSFNELHAGAVFSTPHGVFLKTNQGTLVNLSSGAIQGCGNEPIVVHPDAVLLLDGEHHKPPHGKTREA